MKPALAPANKPTSAKIQPEGATLDAGQVMAMVPRGR
jgi:hypothetical protein